MSGIRLEPAKVGGLEPALARVLQVGTYVSIGLIAVGVVLLIAGGGSPLDLGPPLRLETLLADVGAARPAGFLWLGILGVLVTPAGRVIGAGVGFARNGERTMVAVALGILVVVALGVIAGLVTG